jgi:alpha-L-fucosidase 2
VPYGSYQVLGDLHLKYDYGTDTAIGKPKDYYRELSLDSALAECSFVLNGITYHREYFISFSDDVIVIRLMADKPGKINFTLSINRPERYKTTIHGEELDMSGQLDNGTDGNGMRYIARVRIKHEGGQLVPDDSILQIKSANEAIIYISAGTDFRSSPYKQTTDSLVQTALNQSYQEGVVAHVTAYQKLFDRAGLSLDDQNIKQASLPTDERLKAFAKDPSDNDLPVLYFQFGRYLPICSTRAGLLPPNLQGLWANSIQTP